MEHYLHDSSITLKGITENSAYEKASPSFVYMFKAGARFTSIRKLHLRWQNQRVSLKQSFTQRRAQTKKQTLCMRDSTKSDKPLARGFIWASFFARKRQFLAPLPKCWQFLTWWLVCRNRRRQHFFFFFLRSIWKLHRCGTVARYVTMALLYGANRWEFNSWKLWLMALWAYFLHLISD